MNILGALFATSLFMIIWGITAGYHLKLAEKKPLHKWHANVVIGLFGWLAVWWLGYITVITGWPITKDALAGFHHYSFGVPIVLAIASMWFGSCADWFIAARKASPFKRYALQSLCTAGMVGSIGYALLVVLG